MVADEQQARWRVGAGLGVSFVAFALAVGAALLLGNGAGRGVATAAAATEQALSELAALLPLGYAFGAGMVAAANPCGFALLPAYLGLYLGEASARPRAARVRRALAVSGMVSAGFVALFGAAGLVLSAASVAIARYAPWLGLLVGVAVLVAGGLLLSGRGFGTRLGDQLAARLGPAAQHQGYAGYFAYGLAYGAASLSCTLPIFLAVVGSSVAAGGYAGALAQFVLYALGMGFVISGLTLSTTVASMAAVRRIRAWGRWIEPASAVLLLLAGGYVVFYWLTIGGLLAALV